jgi:hypothetical protein
MRSTLLAALLLSASAALAQTQIKPRVLIMLDTSGSMSWHMTDNSITGGDGSSLYRDGAVTENTYYRGMPIGSTTCAAGGCSLTGTCGAGFDGTNSRLYTAKQAINNVINASGDIDWGLMRYTGATCPVSANPFTPHGCSRNNQCASGLCSGGACACVGSDDSYCPEGEVCRGTQCGTDSILCNAEINNVNYSEIDATCTFWRSVPISYAGSCGTPIAAGSTACATPQLCNSAADCSGGSCTALTGSAMSACTCSGGGQCPASYTCTGGRCLYNLQCVADGGFVIADPASGNAFATIASYTDGIEDYTVTPNNLELRADGETPLAGAARSATNWYNATIGSDAQKLCRPYVLVQLTDGYDDCENPPTAGNPNPVENTAGPVAAAQQFVEATVAGAKTPNKVYVVGLAFGGASNATLNNIAIAGGTTSARLASNQNDIEAALSDIVASSVLVEKCNNADDNCNGLCDEPFPDVAVTGAGCTNPHGAKSCDNGAIPGTHCYGTGTYVCSSDQRSEVCSAPTCATNSALCPTVETCNGVDDDCNGVIDDCTPFSKGSCCTSCPNPQPEICNGLDDDCDGTTDDNVTDANLDCGSSLGICTPGKSTCCTSASGTCTPVAANGSNATGGDTLRCVGGVQATGETCNGLDDNCNGLTDEGATQSCYDLAGMAGVGICKAGTQACTAIAVAPGSGGCPPTGYMNSGKSCPGAAMYGACMGESGPQTEICNGIDDDCNGVIDDNVSDPWNGQACCPTGNAADCMGGGACMPGRFACSMGAQTCVGGVAKSTEVCNGLDDDCNGTTDDVAGQGANCTSGGVATKGPCKAQYECAKNAGGMVVAGPGPNRLTCVQVVGPQNELCNGVDDDCDGTIDDNLNDPAVGVKGGTPCQTLTPLPGTSFPAGGPAPPCDPGTTACKNGKVVCVGEVFPMPNQCNGISTDCTGTQNMNGNCPSGFMCFNGTCVEPCAGGEFPCPGGFVCDNSQTPPLCVPDQCQKLNCPAGQLCQLDTSTGKFACVDPCSKVSCPSGTICKGGVCTDASCKTQGCPTGQKCVGNPPMCMTDPCAGINCPTGQDCDPSTGLCVSSCAKMCPAGYHCDNGNCVAGGCVGVHCDAGYTCVESADGKTGTCVVNLCGSGCVTGQVCCQAMCTADPCAAQTCAANEKCQVDSTNCKTMCIAAPTAPPDSIVGEGGGGGTCAMSGHGSPQFALVLLLLLALAVRRRA